MSQILDFRPRPGATRYVVLHHMGDDEGRLQGNLVESDSEAFQLMLSMAKATDDEIELHGWSHPAMASDELSRKLTEERGQTFEFIPVEQYLRRPKPAENILRALDESERSTVKLLTEERADRQKRAADKAARVQAALAGDGAEVGAVAVGGSLEVRPMAFASLKAESESLKALQRARALRRPIKIEPSNTFVRSADFFRIEIDKSDRTIFASLRAAPKPESIAAAYSALETNLSVIRRADGAEDDLATWLSRASKKMSGKQSVLAVLMTCVMGYGAMGLSDHLTGIKLDRITEAQKQNARQLVDEYIKTAALLNIKLKARETVDAMGMKSSSGPISYVPQEEGDWFYSMPRAQSDDPAYTGSFKSGGTSNLPSVKR